MLDTSPSVSFANSSPGSYKKKLIEVALPLQAINRAAASEKSPQRGRPSTLHLWWARRPLTASRAVLFASLVDDPSSHPEKFPTEAEQTAERKRLFSIIEGLVSSDIAVPLAVLEEARREIRRCVGDELPTAYDPFCGGGAIPIESQRLGLPTNASDLNPVALVITKALTEIPWRFKGRRPVHPSLQGPVSERTWERATGLSADVEAYGRDVLDEARRRIGASYPVVRLDDGGEATVISWIWARTVTCNNPVCGAAMPLLKSLALSNRSGNEWSISPVVDREKKSVSFETQSGKPLRGGTVNRRGAECIVCGEPVTLAYIREEGKAKRLGAQLMAIVAEGDHGRVYLAPNEEHARIALSAQPKWTPDTDLVYNPRHMSPPLYGMTKHRDLFTSRQLLALTTFSDLIREAHARVYADAKDAGLRDDAGIEGKEAGARSYADAVALYLATAVDRLADYNSTLCSWHPSEGKISHVFTRQTLSMAWDYAEANPLADFSGSFHGAIDLARRAVATASAESPAYVFQRDAASEWRGSNVFFCTDPPYYDNVPYADLSDFFYVWLRASIGAMFPDLMASLLVPKISELVADPARFGDDKTRAEAFFEEGIGRAFSIMRENARPDIPTTIFYAYKQADSPERASDDAASRSSIGWETMLSGLLSAGFEIVGTWPMTSELANRLRGQNSNALSSSIVLVCRAHDGSPKTCSRAEFVRALRTELPIAVQRLREASLAAADLEQAAIGPGMAIFSRYRSVLEPDDSSMTIKTALSLINDQLSQILLGEISGVDAESQFALSWFDDFGYDEGKFGVAQVKLNARNAHIERLVESGVALAESGRVRLLTPEEIAVDATLGLRSAPQWSQAMHMVAALVGSGGSDEKAAAVLRILGAGSVEHIKDIAYHCYLICDRAKRASEARDFNAVVQAWPDLLRLANERGGDTLL